MNVTTKSRNGHGSGATLRSMTVLSRVRGPSKALVSAGRSVTPGGGRGRSVWSHSFAPQVLLLVTCRALGVFSVIVLAAVQLGLFRLRGVAAAQAVSRCASRILAIAGVTIDVEGEHQRGQGLVVCNHRSYIDILVILSVTPCSFLCKKEVKEWPLVGGMAERMGVVFVDRSSRESRAETLDKISDEVMAGAELAAFPEGTTSKGPGMRATYPGLFRAAETHGFGVVPMVIEYADPEDAWVGDDTLLRHCLFWLSKPRSEVTLRIAEPDALVLRDSGSYALSERPSLQERAEAWMRDALQDLNDKYARLPALSREPAARRLAS